MLKNRVDRAGLGAAAARDARASDVPASGVRPIDRGPPASATPPPPAYERREALDSVDETSVKLPSPVLLAIARGEHRARPPRRTSWFAMGLLTGALATWLFTGEARARVVTARAWTAGVVSMVHHAVAREAPPPPEPQPE